MLFLSNSIIGPDNHAALWALIASGTALAIWLEQRFRWAARLSAPVLALLIAMLLSNTRVVPPGSPAYDFVGNRLVPLAIPLLLFRANIREIFRSGGRMLLVFHISAVGTLIGTVLAVWLLRERVPPADLTHAAGMMAASYIGGGVNFMALKTSYNVSEAIANPLIVADNFVMAGMFVALLGIGASGWFRARFPHPHSTNTDSASAAKLAAEHWQRKGISLLDVAWAFAFAFAVVAVAGLAGKFIARGFGDLSHASLAQHMLATLCTNKFVLLTSTTLVFATLLARPLAKVNGPEEFGAYLLAIFLFTLGLPANLVSVLKDAPLFFVFCGIIALTNLGVTLAVGKLLQLHLEELLVAVNANLGGAPSAAAMAISAGWPKLVLPALLAGIWGYVIGTPIGVMMVELLRR